MAHEFFLWAQNDTQYYDPLPPGVLAAFSIYLVKNQERTHICSLTPNSYAVWIANEYLLDDPDAEQPDIYTSDQSDYFGFTPHNPDNPHHSPIFKIDGRFSSDRAWREAEEDACANPRDIPILWRSKFLEHENLMLKKRHAENRAPCLSPMLPLFAAAGQALAYEQLKTLHWI